MNRFCPPLWSNEIHSLGLALSPAFGGCVVNGEKSGHSGESRNPVAVLLNNSIFLDARFRGHDEL